MKKRGLILGLVALLALSAIMITQFTTDAIATGAWGLSFRKGGAPPSGPATTQELARFNAAYLGDTAQKVLYLTFDAGYENGCTEKILDILKKHNVPAAFSLWETTWSATPTLCGEWWTRATSWATTPCTTMT